MLSKRSQGSFCVLQQLNRVWKLTGISRC